MLCFCSQKLAPFAADFKLTLPTMPLPSGAMSAMASLSAAMSANVAPSLDAAFSAAAMAKLSLLGSLMSSLKVMGHANLNLNPTSVPCLAP